jgi:hypothetical protein
MESQDAMLQRLQAEGRLDDFRERYAILLREHDGDRDLAMEVARAEFAPPPEPLNDDRQHIRRLAYASVDKRSDTLDDAMFVLRFFHVPWAEITEAPCSSAVSMLAFARSGRGGLNDWMRTVFVRLITTQPESDSRERVDVDATAYEETLQASKKASREIREAGERRRAEARERFRNRVIEEFGDAEEVVTRLMEEAFGSCAAT